MLSGLIETPDLDLRADAVQLSLESLIEKKRWDDAGTVLARSGFDTASPVLSLTLRGRLCFAREDRDAAAHFAAQAKERVSEATLLPLLRMLAQLLSILGRDEDALPFLERCVCLGRFDLDTRRLLDCATRLRRHEVLLRVCRELREAGEEARRLFDTEINLLQFYDPAKAVELLLAFLQGHPEDFLARLWLSFLGLRLGKQDLVTAAPSALPPANEVSVPNGKLALSVFHRTGQTH